MKVNIYYGGRGLVDDPAIYVINKIQEVLEELNVKVTRYNLYESKNTISTLSQTVTEADAVVLAASVEWLGMGGFLQMFLDSCWLYADRTEIGKVYCFPIVMSKTYGEKEIALTLSNAWDIIGGKTGPSLTAYVDENTNLEFNEKYIEIIEKYAENIYRNVNKKIETLPSSSKEIRRENMRETVRFTPEESEQLSKYVSDDEFVKTQKEDIESLANMYKEMLSDQEKGGDNYYIDVFKNNYKPSISYKCTYMFVISDKNKCIYIKVDGRNVDAGFGEVKNADIVAKLEKSTFDSIMEGKMTFHRAFMTGEMTAKGNFKSLKMLDELFDF